MKIRSLLTLGFVLGSVLFTTQKAYAAIQMPESCRMGGCWRTTINSKEAIRTNNLGTLYLVNKSTNQYPAPNTSNPTLAAQDYERFVSFYGSDFVSSTSQSYVFCSKYTPSILFESEGSYIVHRLAIFESPFGYNRGSYQTYLATCHNLAGPDYFSLDVYALLLKEGYMTNYVPQSEQLSVLSPIDVMQLNPREL